MSISVLSSEGRSRPRATPIRGLLSAPTTLADDTSFQIGRYEIRGEIGRGTMGIVYEAHDPSLRRTVALKTFHLSFAVSPKQYKSLEGRFLTEARIAARLSHPGIVAVHDVGCDPEIGTLYMALEYLRGRTLQAVIANGVPLEWREALGITRRVAEALHYAHSLQVVHRDIKPANIMLLPSGEPKILDFGIARMESTRFRLQTCELFGTPLFMAPEQALGDEPDGRADLFSLGSIAYTLLTGRLAFEAPSIPATVRRLIEDHPEPPSRIVRDLPRGLDEVIARAIAKLPEHRYSCGQALVEDIEALLGPPRMAQGKVTTEPAGDDERPGHRDLDVEAELAALVSDPPSTAVAVGAASFRGTPRPLPRVLPAVLAALLCCTLALRGSTFPADGPADSAPASRLSKASSPAPPRIEGATRLDLSLPASLGLASRAPARLKEPAAQATQTLPLVKPARLKIDFEHSLATGTLRLWIDREMVLQEQLESLDTTNIPGLRLRKGRLGRDIAVKPGPHTIRVQVRWDDNERQQILSSAFESGEARPLVINLGRLRKNLSVEWK
jgi:serine/threonine protein kinase